MKVFIRKIKALLTGKVPCSFESEHGHDLEFPSIYDKPDYSAFRCKKCNGVITYVRGVGFVDFQRLNKGE